MKCLYYKCCFGLFSLRNTEPRWSNRTSVAGVRVWESFAFEARDQRNFWAVCRARACHFGRSELWFTTYKSTFNVFSLCILFTCILLMLFHGEKSIRMLFIGRFDVSWNRIRSDWFEVSDPSFRLWALRFCSKLWNCWRVRCVIRPAYNFDKKEDSGRKKKLISTQGCKTVKSLAIPCYSILWKSGPLSGPGCGGGFPTMARDLKTFLFPELIVCSVTQNYHSSGQPWERVCVLSWKALRFTSYPPGGGGEGETRKNRP